MSFRSIASLIIFFALASWQLAGAALADDPDVAEPAGYRMNNFRAPVPGSLAGASVVTLEQAEDLAGSGDVLFVDVLPRPPKPKNLKEGTIWRPRPRHNIPGSTWLPNTGFGGLSEAVERYFQESLSSITEGDKTRKILFYCLADCWMSWNAAKRALSLGYSRVYWFPEGTDAWTTFGLPTERSEPLPGWEPE